MTHAATAPDLRVQALEVVRDFAAAQKIDLEEGTRDHELVLLLPGDKKLKTVCSLIASETDLAVTAFVVRNADENHENVYRYLLRKNLRLPGVAYGIDATGDVYVTGRLPLIAVDEDHLDAILGVVLECADGAFNELLALGFLTSMRREWAWRVSRGESLRNLEAFRELLDTPEARGDDGGVPPSSRKLG